MHVVFLILSVMFFCSAWNHLFIADIQKDRGNNGFLLAVSLYTALYQADKLLS